MRSLGERLTLLRRVIQLKCGPGAAILPAEVTKIHMDFAKRVNGGHMGARKFWQENLKVLKYHNPNVAMILNRHDNQEAESFMTVYFRTNDGDKASTSEPSVQPESSAKGLSPAQPPASNERIVRIDMKGKHSGLILSEFMAATRAVALKPTKEEARELEDLEAKSRRSAMDRERVRTVQAEKRREQDMLMRARAAGGAVQEEEA